MRPDLEVVAGMVPAGSRVLDLGCGDGALLAYLIAERRCEGHGVEIDGDDVLACIAAGVPVSEGDIEDALRDFEEGAFDVVLLSWTLQTTRRPGAVLAGMMRVAPVGVVSFPNFAHWRLRAGLALRGRMPRSQTLPSFKAEIVQVLSPTNPLGIKAGGEGGTTPALAVVVSAIVDALRDLGVRDITMPATPFAVWQAIQNAKAAQGAQA